MILLKEEICRISLENYRKVRNVQKLKTDYLERDFFLTASLPGLIFVITGLTPFRGGEK